MNQHLAMGTVILALVKIVYTIKMDTSIAICHPLSPHLSGGVAALVAAGFGAESPVRTADNGSSARGTLSRISVHPDVFFCYNSN